MWGRWHSFVIRLAVVSYHTRDGRLPAHGYNNPYQSSPTARSSLAGASGDPAALASVSAMSP